MDRTPVSRYPSSTGTFTPGSRAVVAGGAGFLGSHLCERLLLDGCEVTCVDNFVTGHSRNVEALLDIGGFSVHECDIASDLDVPGPVDVVFNLASPASPVDYLRLPIQTLEAGSLGTIQTLKLAFRKKARYVLASTSEVYGDPLVHPQPESYWGNVNPVGLRSVYDEAKRFSESLTMAYRRACGVDTSIVRIFNTYGPRMRRGDGRVVPTFVEQALSGKALTVTGDGSQTRSLCYVDDLVDGLVRLAASRFPGPINLGNPHEVSILTLAEEIRELAESSSSIDFVDLPEDDPRLRRPDISLAGAALGWLPSVSLQRGLSRTITWFRESA
ncbi:UDP-glucuronic acid decarboxylase family protein [Kitasatospora sp. NPDC056783]|uniref:UDP-glucuronic acid decarboxylase family protein n=1 Tax=Kitasatospora sp. NPDC056783 TaxID=3345943 RepID=UPI00369E9564